MIMNYFKTPFRNLWRNKTTSFINLFGFAVGMTAFVFIFLWVENETSFDNYHPDEGNIYRLTSSIHINKNEDWVWESLPMQLTETARKEIPDVEQTARIVINWWSAPVLNINHQLVAEKKSAFIDKSWFNIFQYDFVQGNATAFAKKPFSIVLTESKSKQLFGNASAIGQIVCIDTVNYTVEGIVKDNPSNSSFQFDVLMQIEGRLSNSDIYPNFASRKMAFVYNTMPACVTTDLLNILCSAK